VAGELRVRVDQPVHEIVAQLLRDLRLLVHEVVLLARVRGEVVELPGLVLVEVDGLPALDEHGGDVAVGGITGRARRSVGQVPVERPVEGGGALEHTAQADTIDAAPLPRVDRHAGQVEQGRVEVVGHGRDVDLDPGRDRRVRWEADHQGYAHTAFVQLALAGAQRTIGRDRAEAAVVRGEDEDRVVALSYGVEGVEDAPDALVQALDHGRVDGVVVAVRRGLGLVLLDERLRGLEGGVDRVVGQEEEEGRVARRPRVDEIDGDVGQLVGEIGARR
jgi:hypothetical protein